MTNIKTDTDPVELDPVVQKSTAKKAPPKKTPAKKPLAKPGVDPRLRKTSANELAKHFTLPVENVMAELKVLGMGIASPDDSIDPELIDLVEHHLKDIRASIKREGDRPEVSGDIHIKSPIIVRSLADALLKKPNEVIASLMKMKVLASLNQSIDPDIARKVASSFGMRLIVDHRDKDGHKPTTGASPEDAAAESAPEAEKEVVDPTKLVERPPIVTFMGHVDHGKTSIQDYIRKTKVVNNESGGITQHIGASVIQYKNKSITFIDTPGHEAFTAMRARGANVTDIVVLVVAADDGFMPQTVEALSHAKSAKVPIIVAINKMDLPTANPEKVLLHMQQNGLTSEEWGGEVGVVRVSAHTGEGMDTLLDRINLEAELLELKADPTGSAKGVTLEAELLHGFGAAASVVVLSGTLKTGDIVLCGSYYGKVKTLLDNAGRRVKSAGPSMAVQLVGLSGVPKAGTKFTVMDDERKAAEIASTRTDSARVEQLTKANYTATSLDELFVNIGKAQRNDLNMIIKADVQGSCEAIIESLAKLPSEKIKVNVVHSAVSGISEADVLLASASKAIVVGFHVRVNTGVNDLARKEGVEIRLYSIIYELIEDIKDALEGRLAPDQREKSMGKAKILKIFSMTKGPSVCGCLVEEGAIKVGAKVRVKRGKDEIYKGTIQSLKRFHDDVKEVKNGLECGIRLDNFMDFHEDDFIEAYDIEFKKATL